MAVAIEAERCVGCGCCSDVCTTGALSMHEKAVVREEDCIECGKCTEMCPAMALS